MKCVNCSSTDKFGKFFYACDKCGATFCNSCGSKGKKCPKCNKGFLK